MSPRDVAVAQNGDVYFTDQDAHSVARVTPAGRYFRVAGLDSHLPGPFAGDGTPATNCPITAPRGLSLGPDGSVYFVANGHEAVYRVSPAGLIYKLAGDVNGSHVDDTLAIHFKLHNPLAVAVGPDGSVFVSSDSSGRSRIHRIATTGRIRRYAGRTDVGTVGPLPSQGGKADSIALNRIDDMAVDANGTLYFTQEDRDELGQINPSGRLTSVFGTGVINTPGSVAIGPDGSLYFTMGSPVRQGVYRRGDDGSVAAAAGDYAARSMYAPGRDGVFARAMTFGGIQGIAVARDGALYVAQIGSTTVGGTGCGMYRIASELPGAAAGEISYPSPDGAELYVFNINGRHLRTEDAVTRVVTHRFTYDASGQLVTIQDANGDITEIHRTASGGHPMRIVGPYGHVTALDTLGSGELGTVTNPASESHLMTYYSGGLLNTFTNPRGNAWSYSYAADGRLWQDDDPRTVPVTALAVVDTGVTRTVTRTSPAGRVTTYTVQRMLDGIRRRFILGPDQTESRLLQRFQEEQASATPPIPAGERWSTKSPTGDSTVTSLARDPRFSWFAPVGGIVTAHLPSGLARVTTQSRTGVAVHTESATINGRTYTAQYDTLLRKWTLITPAGRTRTAYLDAAGRPTALHTSGFAALKLGYDARGKLTSLVTRISQPQPLTWTYGYDAQGYLRTLTDPLQRQSTLDSYDPCGRLLQETLPGGRVVGYGYDAGGNLTSLTPPGRPAHTFGYDPVDEPDSYTPPAVPGIADPATRYAYDPDRLLDLVTRPDGGVVNPHYAAASGLLDSVSHARGRVSYTYTSAATGRLPETVTAVDVPTGRAVTVASTYDGSLLKSEAWSGAVSGTVAVDYDTDFRVSHQHVNGDDVVYGYDPDGLLTSAQVTGLGTLSLARGPKGLVDSTHVTAGGGTMTSSARYDSLGQLEDLHYSRGGVAYYHENLVRDALGRVIQISETWGSGAAVVREIHYDAAGRLDSVSTGGARLEGYTYDGNGNRMAWRGVGSADTASATYDAQDRMLRYGGDGYAYTANGEMTQRTGASGTRASEYDALGNLVRAIVANGDTLDYAADGQGRRVARYRNRLLERTWLYEDELSVVLEVGDQGGTQRRYVYATQEHSPDLLVWGTSGTGYTLHRVVTDHLGSVRAVVRIADGAEVQRIDYDAWGRRTLDPSPTFQSLGYAGGLDERESGLVRFGARDYEARVGRWTSKDPIGFEGDGPGLYEYVRSRPLLEPDPSGLGHFGRRPIRPVRYPTPPRLSWLDDGNCECIHEQYFTDTGGDFGFFDRGGWPFSGRGEIRADDPRFLHWYDHGLAYYDDATMLTTLDNIRAEWEQFRFIRRNCQAFADALRREYSRLFDGPHGH